ncbi:hypothetical protein [Novosphingobium sp. 9U]|uniref:hypothetical protein n=1 Tax=Novosphingobium sp. 9U TaxID=2653158 RepID=UPI001F4055ED|nr:hypothetical protein [Novosphingobium sp. 9U]
MLLAFLAGAGGVAYLAWHGDLARYLPAPSNAGQSSATGGAQDAVGSGAASQVAGGRTQPAMNAVVSMEARLAMLEDRFSRLDFQASAASGNAARAEALLIASSARRLVERGAQLGFVADQLTLRFGDAQPQAVQTITTFARNPVTIDQLTARLEALAPDLTDTSQSMNLWSRTRQEVANLFTVHSDSPTLLTPAARIDRARLMLTARRIDNAIDEVERMPGAEAAQKWIADARRFEDAQRALDLIETTAMLEPRRLKDGSGQDVTQSSPLSTPEPSPTPSGIPTAR